MPLDEELFQIIFSAAHRWAVLDVSGVFFARYAPYLLAFGFLILLAGANDWRKRWLLALEAALAVLLARGIVTEAIRFFVSRPRPFEVLRIETLIPQEGGGAFPSGHAAFFFALATLVFLYNRRWGLAYLFFALLIGIARVFSGIHWPADIILGMLVGMGSALAIRALVLSGKRGEKSQSLT
jgi:undecaprenyl-diphosphatase